MEAVAVPGITLFGSLVILTLPLPAPLLAPAILLPWWLARR